MALTYSRALDQLAHLRATNTLNAATLQDVVNSLDVTATGNVTVLYSGKLNGVDTGDIARGMYANGDSVRIIDNTDAAKFLDIRSNVDFRNALIDVFNSLPDERGTPANDFLYGARDANGNRVTSGVWDDVSARFVDATVGEVRTLTSHAGGDGVFAQTEIARALAPNSAITSIDGLPIDVLRQVHAEAFAANGGNAVHALDVVRQTVSARSLIETGKLAIAVDGNGVPLAFFDGVRVDSRAFLSDLSGIHGNAPLIQLPLRSLTEFLPSPTHAAFDNGVGGLNRIEEILQARAVLSGTENAATRAAARTALEKLGIAGDVLALAMVALDANAAYAAGDSARGKLIIAEWALEFAGGMAGGILAAQLAASALAPLYLAGPAGALIAGGLTLIAGIAGGLGAEAAAHGIAHQVASLFATANALSPNAPAAPRRDPLSFDLDGDGIETIGIDTANPILFDHTGSGVKTATGWLGADDAFLALDRNGNGSIDSGRELFGDSTLLPDGSEAVDGFAALAAEDTNADGRVDAQDANFASLRLWKDLDQDGISDAGELQTLTEAGIASIAVAKTENAVPLANGNQIADLGTYTRIDGSTGGIGDTATLADVDLASRFAQCAFFSEFTDHIALTPQAQTLPDMQGSGLVRNLREAASLQTAAGQHLASVLAAYAAATTQAAQRALLPDLVDAWAATSTMGERAGPMGARPRDVGDWSRTASAANDAQWIDHASGIAA